MGICWRSSWCNLVEIVKKLYKGLAISTSMAVKFQLIGARLGEAGPNTSTLGDPPLVSVTPLTLFFF